MPNLSTLPKGTNSLSLYFALPAERIVLVGAQNVTWSTFQCRDVPSHFSSQIVSDTFHRQDNVIGFFPAQPVSETLHASSPIANSCTLSISQSYLGKSFQKHFFVFFSSPSPSSTCPMYTLHTHIVLNAYVLRIHIKIGLISSSVVTTIMSSLTIILDGHL